MQKKKPFPNTSKYYKLFSKILPCQQLQTNLYTLDPTLFVFAEEVLGLSIPKRTTRNNIDPNKNNDSDDKYEICFTPIFSKVSQKTSFAWVAIVTKLALVVVP